MASTVQRNSAGFPQVLLCDKSQESGRGQEAARIQGAGGNSGSRGEIQGPGANSGSTWESRGMCNSWGTWESISRGNSGGRR